MSKERIIWLDAMKGIGIILVMISHLGLNIPYGEYLFGGYIPLFFVAAGFTYRPAKEFKDVLHKKFLRLMLPYFIYGCGATVMFYVIEANHDLLKELLGLLYGRFSYLKYPLYGESRLMASIAGPLWFLPAMFVSYCFLVAWECYKSNKLFVFSIVVLQLLFLLQPYLLPWSLDCFLFYSCFILIGFKLKDYLFREKRMVLFLCTIVSYVFIIFYNDWVNLSICQWGNFGRWSFLLCILIGVLYSYIVANICQIMEKTIIVRIFAYIGRLSLRFLCIHMPVGVFTFMFLMKFGLWPKVYFLGYIYQFAVVFVVAIGLEKVLSKYSKKYSILKYV